VIRSARLAASAAAVVSLLCPTGTHAHTWKPPVPASLDATESAAEDLADVAQAGSRAGVVSGADELEETASGPAATALAHAGVPAAEIARLEQRARRVARVARSGSFVSVLLASNAVSALMPDLYARFADPVPPLVQKLDYLDREAQFRSLAHQSAKVAEAVRELRATWARVRPKVVGAGGASQAAAYSAHVAAMERLDPAAAAKVQGEAVRGLALVDELERVFG
jgi:hypothetical protein